MINRSHAKRFGKTEPLRRAADALIQAGRRAPSDVSFRVLLADVRTAVRATAPPRRPHPF